MAREQGLEKLFGPLQSLIGEHDGLGLVGRLANQSLPVKPIKRIPVKPLQGPALNRGKRRQLRLVVGDLQARPAVSLRSQITVPLMFDETVLRNV